MYLPLGWIIAVNHNLRPPYLKGDHLRTTRHSVVEGVSGSAAMPSARAPIKPGFCTSRSSRGKDAQQVCTRWLFSVAGQFRKSISGMCDSAGCLRSLFLFNLSNRSVPRLWRQSRRMRNSQSPLSFNGSQVRALGLGGPHQRALRDVWPRRFLAGAQCLRTKAWDCCWAQFCWDLYVAFRRQIQRPDFGHLRSQFLWQLKKDSVFFLRWFLTATQAFCAIISWAQKV